MKIYLSLILFAILVAATIANAKPNRRGTGRITNGTTVRHLYQFPYQVGIFAQDVVGGSTGGWCGGSLISNQWILTAAHCLDGMEGSLIYLGVIDKEATHKYEVKKSNFIIHKRFSFDTMLDDIALIKLPTPVQLSSNIKPIALDNDPSILKWVNKNAIASGWGETITNGPDTRYLQYTEVKIMSNEGCARYWNEIKQTQICQKVINNQGTCRGDSGGPLAATEMGERVLIGITSFGDVPCEIGGPKVYTRVGAYRKWICDNTGKNIC